MAMEGEGTVALGAAMIPTHGLTQAIHVLNNKTASGPPESRQFARDFAEFVRQGKIQRSGEYFTASFSLAGDDLGQWQAYANDAKGYALGFDARVLESQFLKESGAPLLRTFPVSYDDACLIEIHERLIDRMFGLISLPRGRGLGDDAINGYMAELFSVTTVHALHAGLYFKHEAYRNEREYRFLRVYPPETPSSRVKLRDRAGRALKYEEFDWKGAEIDPLQCIVIGPATTDAEGTKVIKESLLVSGMTGVKIIHSLIPYRATRP
jgi:hypothetical protein